MGLHRWWRGVRDYVSDLSQKLLKSVDNNLVQDQIRSIGLTTNKQYHLGDNLSAEYRHTDLASIKAKLGTIGFEFVRQLNGGFDTDFDRPFCEDKFLRKNLVAETSDYYSENANLRCIFIRINIFSRPKL